MVKSRRRSTRVSPTPRRADQRRARRASSSLIKRLLIAVSVLFIGCTIATAIGYLLNSNTPGAYKLEHLGAIEEAAADSGVDPYLVLAVIKVESGWDEDAESHAGARGLMQVMPETARHVIDAGMLGEKTADPGMLDDADHNIRIGTAYLGYLLERFDNKTVALAAYNAGPTRAQRWIDAGGAFEDAIDISETRAYVRRVQDTESRYRELHPDAFG